MINVLKLHDGGEGLTCIQPNQQQEKMRSILVHGLVQKDAQDGFPLLNAMKNVLKVKNPHDWELATFTYRYAAGKNCGAGERL